MAHLIDSALDVIAALVSNQPKFDALNKQARELFGDFAPHATPVADCIYPGLIALLDAALGDDKIASYFLNECTVMREGGSVHEQDGTVWPLRTVEDLRAYVRRDCSNAE